MGGWRVWGWGRARGRGVLMAARAGPARSLSKFPIGDELYYFADALASGAREGPSSSGARRRGWCAVAADGAAWPTTRRLTTRPRPRRHRQGTLSPESERGVHDRVRAPRACDRLGRGARQAVHPDGHRR